MIWVILYIFLGFICVIILNRLDIIDVDDFGEAFFSTFYIIIWPFVAIAGISYGLCRLFDYVCDLIEEKWHVKLVDLIKNAIK